MHLTGWHLFLVISQAAGWISGATTSILERRGESRGGGDGHVWKASSVSSSRVLDSDLSSATASCARGIWHFLLERRGGSWHSGKLLSVPPVARACHGGWGRKCGSVRKSDTSSPGTPWLHRFAQCQIDAQSSKRVQNKFYPKVQLGGD